MGDRVQEEETNHFNSTRDCAQRGINYEHISEKSLSAVAEDDHKDNDLIEEDTHNAISTD